MIGTNLSACRREGSYARGRWVGPVESRRAKPVRLEYLAVSIKVTVSQVAPSPEGLLLGVVVEHTKAKWMRFSTCVLAPKHLTYAERQYLLAFLEGYADMRDEEYDEPLF